MSSNTHTRTPTSSHKLNTGPDDIDNGNTDGKEHSSPMYTIPIADRPPHGPLFSKIFFPLLFNFGQIGINSGQILALPLLLIPVFGRGWFEGVIGWTKDGYGRLLIAITVLFAPTSLIITTDSPPSLSNPPLVERDSNGRMTRINLPDRLVVMANHQAYTDWMYLWILACYSGHSRGVVILLKEALKNIPVVGWGMRFFKFIFLKRSWAGDRVNLTKSLTDLCKHAKGTDIPATPSLAMQDETAALLSPGQSTGSQSSSANARTRSKRSPLWLFIFPEGTITSDEERVKSKRYADREGIDDFKTTLHPRSTGLLFILRTLLPQIPDLQLLDVTIGYPGVPYGAYPQDYYGLISIFWRSVPPPTVHLHLKLHDNLVNEDISGIPSLSTTKPSAETGVEEKANDLASPEEARAFELWLRGVWGEKEKRMEGFSRDQRFFSSEPERDSASERRSRDGEGDVEVVKIRQVRWYDWIGAVGGGGMMTLGLGIFIWRMISHSV